MGAVCKYPDWIRRITEKVKNERGYGRGGGQKGKIFLCIAFLKKIVCVLGWGEWFLPQACKFISPQSSSKHEEKEWYDRDEI